LRLVDEKSGMARPGGAGRFMDGPLNVHQSGGIVAPASGVYLDCLFV